jgi:hypothetical protein
MPPSVALQLLPNTSAQAIKELRRGGFHLLFFATCCTNNTQLQSGFWRKPLIIKAFLKS